MQIFISALGAYNSGTLHGEWVELETTTDKATLDAAIAQILRTSPTPNVWRQDYENNTGDVFSATHRAEWGWNKYTNNPIFPISFEHSEYGVGIEKDLCYRSEEEWAVHDYDKFPNLGEYVSTQEIVDILELMDEYGEDVVCAVLEAESDVKYAKSMLDEFVGKYDSFCDYADEYANEMLGSSDTSDFAKQYFDYASFARDLKYDYTVSEYDGSVYIFGN